MFLFELKSKSTKVFSMYEENGRDHWPSIPDLAKAACRYAVPTPTSAASIGRMGILLGRYGKDDIPHFFVEEEMKDRNNDIVTTVLS